MKKKKIKLLAIVLTILFTFNTIGIIFYNDFIPNINQSESEKSSKKDLVDKKIINDKIDNNESFNLPKTANPPNNPIELEQNYDFSFKTNISETWNTTIYMKNQRNNRWMIIPDTMGYNATFEVFISDLINGTTGTPMNIGDLPVTNRTFAYLDRNEIPKFYSPIPIDGHIGPNTDSFSLSSGISFIFWTGNPGYYVRFNMTVILNDTRTRNNIITTFDPTPENTQSDLITWNLQFTGYINGNYSARLEIENFTDFNLKSVLGNDHGYWKPINYKKTSTKIILNESYTDYIIELQTLNRLTIVYNDNLTLPDNNELKLYITCNIGGNLTIYFKNSTRGITKVSQSVNEGDNVYFNYIMYNYTAGGVGSLEVSLINKSTTINFGIKIAEIIFYKNTLIGAYSQNTTAFTDFLVLAAYFDTDKLNWLYYQNNTGKISKTNDQILDLSMIHNANVTYELEGLYGELHYDFVPGINFELYNKIVDLRDFQIVPGEYNLTFKANKIGYRSLTYITPIVISKKDVMVVTTIIPSDAKLIIEETFAITIQFIVSTSYPPYYEAFLRKPVNITFSILKDGKLDDEFLIPNVIQSYTLSGPMTNDSIPGDYTLNISIVSDYYKGNSIINATVEKKPLTVSLLYDEDDLKEDEEFEIQWELTGGGSKNRENMSLEVYIDGIFQTAYSLKNSYGGVTRLELNDGEYDITYRLISPFYTAETTIKLDIEAKKEPEPTWLEENWLWVVIGIISVIAMAALAIFLLISRHKIKAKRALESELIALKTKTSTAEQNISLIETQISQIASIYWILVIHSEQGVTMIEIKDFKFEKVISVDQKELIGKGTIRDSALIGGFLTAIRNFSRETSGTSLEYQPVFNSQTDYSTIVDDNEIHRRILEGTQYFMAFVSSKGTIEISAVLSSVNSLFQDNYGKAVKKFDGAISPFKSFEKEVVSYLHSEIRDLQKKLSEERLLLERFESHLKDVQEKIGIKPKKLR